MITMPREVKTPHTRGESVTGSYTRGENVTRSELTKSEPGNYNPS